MSIDLGKLDKLVNKFELSSNGKWYARTYSGSTIVYEDEITGYTYGPVPGELNDIYAAQRTAVFLGGRQVVSTTDPVTGKVEILSSGKRFTVPYQSYELADRFFDARPPSLVPVNSVKMRAYAHDGQYLFGTSTNYNSVYRMLLSDAAPTEIYAFPVGNQVYSIYCELGVVLAVVFNTTTSLYSLYRSSDIGVTFSKVQELGIGSNGQQNPGVSPFIRGLCSGRLSDGRDAIICTTYHVDQVSDPVLPKDRRYAIISYDKGQTWSLLWELNVGVRNTRHFHGVKIDDSGRIIVMLGDGDTECAIVVAQDVTKWPFPNNVTPAQLSAYPGFYVATGAQNHRCVDCVVIMDADGTQRLVTYTDTASDGFGGIWSRDYPTLANPTRVAHPNFGQTHDGWLFARNSSGVMYACDASLSGLNMYFNVSGSADGGLHWFPVGKYYMPSNGYISSFFFTPDGCLAISAGAGAGPAGARVTHIYRLGETCLDDDIEAILAPVCYVRPGGNDSNDGSTPALALATVRAAMTSQKCSSKCRIVVQGDAGPNTSAFITQARFGSFNANTTNNTADTSIYYHVSGDGRDKTVLEVTGTGGISGLGAAAWSARLDHLTIYRATADLLLVDNSAQTGAAAWVTTDCQIGESAHIASHNVYLQTATFKARRTLFVSSLTDAFKYAIYAKQDGIVDAKSCLFIGGVFGQFGAANVSVLQSTFDKFLGYKIGAAATVAPNVKNCNFGEGTATASVINTPSLDLSATVVGNYFPTIGGASNIPAQYLPVGSAALVGAGYRPKAGSPLSKSGVSTGVLSDYYGAPFRAYQSVGAVQAYF